ncbi:MAG: phosphodiester glycosidase family protein [Armatimonadota bacterium]
MELYDQDEDDQVPFDDHAEFKSRGVAQISHHLNESGRGKVVAAWNGLFFQYNGDIASHVAPVVLDGKARYNVGVVRWAVGVKYKHNKPVFRVIRMPDIKSLASKYDFAAEGASCLILNSRPLKLQPFPKPNEAPFPQSKPPAPDESGFVRKVDHIRTSRTSMAWSKDNRHFYLLIVKEPDAEAPSIIAFKNHLPLMGGWTTADLQRFWQQFGAWCAVNLDGGDVTQMAALRKDGRYDLIPARWGDNNMQLTFSPNFQGAPSGGSMMYFFIGDIKSVQAPAPK